MQRHRERMALRLACWWTWAELGMIMKMSSWGERQLDNSLSHTFQKRYGRIEQINWRIRRNCAETTPRGETIAAVAKRSQT
ncbi:hypothetical protein F4824DRAFT_442542 [Ustulina deusta]|nr:hypothetical protein F4824DRAFT_442542 [Ustulina deusta]